MDLNINKSTFVTNDRNELKNCNEETEIQQRDAKQRKKCKRNYKYQRVKDLKCGICPDILFTSEKEYLLHIRDEHEGKIIDSYMCNVCGKTFKTRSELVQHIKSKCGTERKFVCKECGQKLMSAGSLHNHMKRHKDSANFMCRFCAKLFLFAGQLKVHERIHTQEKDFVCEICGKGFCHRQSLITHISVHTGIKPYQCESCSKSFSCIGNLLKHRKSHKDTCGMTPLTSHRVQNPSTKIKVRINTPASSLLKKTERKRRLQEKFAQLDSKADDDEVIEDVAESEVEQDVDDVGEAISTSEDERVQKQTDMKPRKLRKRDPQLDANVSNFISERKLETGMTATCKYCAKEYTNFRWLYKHEKEHENCMNDGDFKCSCCRKGFESKQSLKEHQLQVHADVLTCHECVVDKIFSSIDSLKSHRDIFHNGIPRKEYTYVCEKCGKKFKQKSLLQVHNSTDCGSVPHFRCRVCDKDFSSYHSQKAHMRIHTGQKDLECKFCGKSFRWKGQLKVHERSHTGEKPYTCLFCPSAFAYRDSLITHSTIHTGIKPYLCKSCGWRFSCVGNLVKHKVTHASTCGAWYKENGEKS